MKNESKKKLKKKKKRKIRKEKEKKSTRSGDNLTAKAKAAQKKNNVDKSSDAKPSCKTQTAGLRLLCFYAFMFLCFVLLTKLRKFFFHVTSAVLFSLFCFLRSTLSSAFYSSLYTLSILSTLSILPLHSLYTLSILSLYSFAFFT